MITEGELEFLCRAVRQPADTVEFKNGKLELVYEAEIVSTVDDDGKWRRKI